MPLERWTLDVARSTISFTVRHLVVSKVRGTFTRFRGSFAYDDAHPHASSVEAEIEVASVETRDPLRDGFLRTGDCLDTERFPHMSFQSTSVSGGRGRFQVTGDLTLRGVTKPVVLDVEDCGTRSGRARFKASAELLRKEFGVSFNQVVDAGGVAVGEKIDVRIEVEATPALSVDEAAGAVIRQPA